MYQDWVEYIKLSKNGLGLGRKYKAEEGWIRVGRIYQAEEGWIRVG